MFGKDAKANLSTYDIWKSSEDLVEYWKKKYEHQCWASIALLLALNIIITMYLVK